VGPTLEEKSDRHLPAGSHKTIIDLPPQPYALMRVEATLDASQNTKLVIEQTDIT